jgi:hypothetical protein
MGEGERSGDHAAYVSAVRSLRETPAADLAARRAELQQAAEDAGLTLEDISQVLNSRSDLPRSLLPEERSTLLFVVEHESSGEDQRALLAQAQTAQVTGYCGCPCATVDLAVDRTVPAARNVPSPIGATVLDAYGRIAGDVLVFLNDGYLSLLEMACVPQMSPFPSADRLR